jgi:hypothetical protein
LQPRVSGRTTNSLQIHAKFRGWCCSNLTFETFHLGAWQPAAPRIVSQSCKVERRQPASTFTGSQAGLELGCRWHVTPFTQSRHLAQQIETALRIISGSCVAIPLSCGICWPSAGRAPHQRVGRDVSLTGRQSKPTMAVWDRRDPRWHVEDRPDGSNVNGWWAA